MILMTFYSILIQSSRSLSTTACILASEVRVRFAPSPTGDIHLGGLRTAFYNYIFAKQNKGKFVLRIEDTDQTRLVPGSATAIESILRWANISPDESPTVGGNFGPYIQSERLEVYRKHAQILLDSGRAYKCFCSPERLELLRKQQARNREKFGYDGKCKHLTHDEIEEKQKSTNGFVVRFAIQPTVTSFDDIIFGKIENDFVASREGDPILVKSDKYPTYHFANVVDDRSMRISHVLRGSEWITSTAKHVQIYEAFGWSPPKFGHFPLITMKDGSKMSKRNNDCLIQSWINLGYRPLAILNFLTTLGGGVPKTKQDSMEIWNLDEIVNCFNFHELTRHPASVDLERLKQININDIKKSWLENPSIMLNELRKLLLMNNINTDLTDEQLKSIICKFIGGRIVSLNDLLSDSNRYLWQWPGLAPMEEFLGLNLNQIIEDVIDVVEGVDVDDVEQLELRLENISKERMIPRPQFFRLMRKLLTKSNKGPPVIEIFRFLGKDRLISYLKNSLNSLSLVNKL